jgi:cytochrome P450/glutathione S-transferase
MYSQNNTLDDVKFVKNFTYSKFTPTFYNDSILGSNEIARWVLDYNSILYINRSYRGVGLKSKVQQIVKKPLASGPILQMTDACIYDTDSVVRFFEERGGKKTKLIPDESGLKNEVLNLYHLFRGEFFETKITIYFYHNLLSHKKDALKVLNQNQGFFRKLSNKLFFAGIKKRIISEYSITEQKSIDSLSQIRNVFDQVDELLKDGRKYLVGDSFSLADLAFSAIAAPLILPLQYGGILPSLDSVSSSYRDEIFALRARPAGQFVFKVYLENRPDAQPVSAIRKEPNFIKKGINKLTVRLQKKQTNLFSFLQRKFPILKVPFIKLVLVNRNDLLVEVIERDLDFTIEEINNKKMSDQKGAFFLGWDRNNPQMNRERDFTRKAARREDLEIIRKFVREEAEAILSNAQPFGKIDLASSLTKPVIVRLIDFYFGVPNPSETVMKDWLRIQFFDLFLNFSNNQVLHNEAVKAGEDRAAFLIQVIQERRRIIEAKQELPDNLFNRMIIMSYEPGYEWVDDDVLQRNIGGLLTGIQEGTNKSVMLIIDELFNQPEAFKKATEVAHSADMTKMYGYVSEALRFNPTQPGVIRYAESDQKIMGKGPKIYTIKAKSKVMALTACAMQDPAAFPNPKQFDGERKDVTYMNYGFGLHECYGKYINAVTLTEIVAATLRQKNLRRSEGAIGNGVGLVSGLLPTNFVVEFN